MSRHEISPVLTAALCVVLSSCVPFEPFPRRIGPYANVLYFHDITEIRDIVRVRKDLKHPICLIDVLAPDRALVSSGASCEPPGGVVSQFIVYKRNGHWMIDDSSIREIDLIVTERRIGLTSRGRQPLAAEESTFHKTPKLPLQIKLALASAG